MNPLREDISQTPILAAVPRQVRIRTKALIVPIAPALIFAVAVSWLLHSAGSAAGVRRTLASRGRETDGTVTKLVWSPGSRSRCDSESPGFHRFAFEYAVAGQTFSGLSAQFEENKLPAPGSKVSVTYLPENPAAVLLMAKSQIPSGWPLRDWPVLVGLAAGAIGLGWRLLWAALALRREYRLARHGEAAVGTVTGVKVVSAPREGRLFGARVDMGKATLPGPPGLTYQFRALEGREVQGEMRRVSSEQRKGSQLTILYDPGNPANHVPFDALSYVVL